MKSINVFVWLLGLCFCTSDYLWASDAFDHLLWYQSIEVSHSTTFRKNIFEDNDVTTDSRLSNIYDDQHLVLTSYNYINQFAYRYLFVSLLFNYTYGEDQFFDINNKLDNHTVVYSQYTLIPEIFFKWKSLALGFGYFFTFDGETPHRYAFLFNRDSPFFKFNFDQKLGKSPLYFLSRFYVSPKEFDFEEDSVYSFSVGFRWDTTYYISLSLLYTRTYLRVEGVEDNIIKIHFSYKVLPYLSLGTRYANLIYTEGRNPYNEISLYITYLHDFHRE